MFELGSRIHPPRALYRSYSPRATFSSVSTGSLTAGLRPARTFPGLKTRYRLVGHLPTLVYVKEPAPDRETRLSELLQPFVPTIGLRTRAHTLLDLHLCRDLTLANVWDIAPPRGSVSTSLTPPSHTRAPVISP
jgi:hypothetical protein